MRPSQHAHFARQRKTKARWLGRVRAPGDLPQPPSASRSASAGVLARPGPRRQWKAARLHPACAGGKSRGPCRAAAAVILFRCVRPPGVSARAHRRPGKRPAYANSALRPHRRCHRASLSGSLALLNAPCGPARCGRKTFGQRPHAQSVAQGAYGWAFGPSLLAPQPPAPFLCGPGPSLADPQRGKESLVRGLSPPIPPLAITKLPS